MGEGEDVVLLKATLAQHQLEIADLLQKLEFSEAERNDLLRRSRTAEVSKMHVLRGMQQLDTLVKHEVEHLLQDMAILRGLVNDNAERVTRPSMPRLDAQILDTIGDAEKRLKIFAQVGISNPTDLEIKLRSLPARPAPAVASQAKGTSDFLRSSVAPPQSVHVSNRVGLSPALTLEGRKADAEESELPSPTSNFDGTVAAMPGSALSTHTQERNIRHGTPHAAAMQNVDYAHSSDPAALVTPHPVARELAKGQRLDFGSTDKFGPQGERAQSPRGGEKKLVARPGARLYGRARRRETAGTPGALVGFLSVQEQRQENRWQPFDGDANSGWEGAENGADVGTAPAQNHGCTRENANMQDVARNVEQAESIGKSMKCINDDNLSRPLIPFSLNLISRPPTWGPSLSYEYDELPPYLRDETICDNE